MYPGAIDSIATVTSGEVIASSFGNTLSTAIVALEETVGANPVPSGYSNLGAAVKNDAATIALYLSQNIQ